jgi:F-type H+-transporting ATPase subunit O
MDLFGQYTAAAKTNALDSASKALASLGQVLKSDPKLGVILHAPTLTKKDKGEIIAELERHTGGQDKSKIVVQFMETLAENNRLGLLEGICEKFSVLMGASRGEMELVITSAQVWSFDLYAESGYTDYCYRKLTTR